MESASQLRLPLRPRVIMCTGTCYSQLDSVIKLLPRLQYGLDVNVRFNDIRGFEFTEEMAAFDMSGITLLHGWIVDPEDKHTVKA